MKRKKLDPDKMSTEELKQVVYELGIDEALENPNISREDLLDYFYDYGRDAGLCD